MNLVKEYVEIHNIKSSFKNNRPGKDWLKGFMTRHKLKKANINRKKQPSVPITREESTPQQTIQQSLTPATFLCTSATTLQLHQLLVIDVIVN